LHVRYWISPVTNALFAACHAKKRNFRIVTDTDSIIRGRETIDFVTLGGSQSMRDVSVGN